MVKTALTAPDGPPSDVEEIKEKVIIYGVL